MISTVRSARLCPVPNLAVVRIVCMDAERMSWPRILFRVRGEELKETYPPSPRSHCGVALLCPVEHRFACTRHVNWAALVDCVANSSSPRVYCNRSVPREPQKARLLPSSLCIAHTSPFKLIVRREDTTPLLRDDIQNDMPLLKQFSSQPGCVLHERDLSRPLIPSRVSHQSVDSLGGGK